MKEASLTFLQDSVSVVNRWFFYSLDKPKGNLIPYTLQYLILQNFNIL